MDALEAKHKIQDVLVELKLKRGAISAEQAALLAARQVEETGNLALRQLEEFGVLCRQLLTQ